MELQTIEWVWIVLGWATGMALIFAACVLAAKGAGRGWIAACWTLGYLLGWIALGWGSIAVADALAAEEPGLFLFHALLVLIGFGLGTHRLIRQLAHIASQSPSGHRVAIEWWSLAGPTRVKPRRPRMKPKRKRRGG